MTVELVPSAASRPTVRQSSATGAAPVPARVAAFPRLRYMGSKYALLPVLHDVFSSVASVSSREPGGRGGAVRPSTAIDAFSGSGVVSYLMKAEGRQVVSNDFLAFPAVIARASVVNGSTTLSDELVDEICGPPADDRDVVRRTFDGVFFSADDRAFLDSAWSHVDRLVGAERDLAIAGLVLAAARKQPRGVFTFTGARYDDGRRDLRLTMAEQFRAAVRAYGATVFDDGLAHEAVEGDVADLGRPPADLVYLDPPYAPPRDDADYMKRYHFLQGLAVYWRGQTIMTETKTKKIAKLFTPFAYPRTVDDALVRTFEQFADAGALVLSYSSNAVPSRERIEQLMRTVKPHVEVRVVDHTYSFGTHRAATRTAATEYVFVGRDRP
ncbi:DNA adenine methylase [Frigoribacterium sp. NPDC087798]|uniref:DNA adenine methylase n=1 Tax=Frigoribacterium sp. NPDC087798 TaxID=3363993 RepID=UPI0038069AA9